MEILIAGLVGVFVGALLAANIPAVRKFLDLDEFWAGIYRGSKGMYGTEMPLPRNKKKKNKK